jgi:hypothetical protein
VTGENRQLDVKDQLSVSFREPWLTRLGRHVAVVLNRREEIGFEDRSVEQESLFRGPSKV